MTDIAPNPYRAPSATLDQPDTAYAAVPYLGFKDRIGRSRYFAYSLIGTLLLAIPVLALSGLLALNNNSLLKGVSVLLILLCQLAIIAFQLTLAVRRVHDFNCSGWWGLLGFLPLLNLALLLIPGSAGANRFGLQPKPSKWGVVLALLLVVFAVLGVLAAVAVPAYQQYVQRARAAQAAPAELAPPLADPQ